MMNSVHVVCKECVLICKHIAYSTMNKTDSKRSDGWNHGKFQVRFNCFGLCNLALLGGSLGFSTGMFCWPLYFRKSQVAICVQMWCENTNNSQTCSSTLHEDWRIQGVIWLVDQFFVSPRCPFWNRTLDLYGFVVKDAQRSGCHLSWLLGMLGAALLAVWPPIKRVLGRRGSEIVNPELMVQRSRHSLLGTQGKAGLVNWWLQLITITAHLVSQDAGTWQSDVRHLTIRRLLTMVYCCLHIDP